MHFVKLVSQALDLSFRHKILWWFNLIPTLFLVLGGGIFMYAFYKPLVTLYALLGRAGSESLEVLDLIQGKISSGLTFMIPLLIVFLAMAIISKNALIKSVQLIVDGQPVSMGGAWKSMKGYFGATMLLILCLAGISFTAHFVEVYSNHVNAHENTWPLINLIMEVLIVFSGLFSLHYVLIKHDPALSALRKGFHLSSENFLQMLFLFLFLITVALLVVSLLGAVAGISYYVSLLVGMMVGLIMMVVLIPVNVFLTTVWTLFFLTMAPKVKSQAPVPKLA